MYAFSIEIPEVPLKTSTVAMVPVASDWFPVWTKTRRGTTRYQSTYQTTQGNSIDELLKRPPQADRTVSFSMNK